MKPVYINFEKSKMLQNTDLHTAIELSLLSIIALVCHWENLMVKTLEVLVFLHIVAVCDTGYMDRQDNVESFSNKK